MKTKQLLCVLIFLLPYCIMGMEEQLSPIPEANTLLQKYGTNTYNGQAITPENILDLAPSMPEALQLKAHTYLTSPCSLTNKPVLDVVKTLTKNPINKNLQDLQTHTKDYNREVIFFNSTSRHNCIIHPTEEASFCIKISGFTSRAYSQIASTGVNPYWDSNTQSQRNWNTFDFTSVAPNQKTYQHVSAIAHYLRIKELVEKENFKRITLIPVYPLHIPGQPMEFCDSNYVVVKPWIKDLKRIKENISPEKKQRFINDLGDDGIRELRLLQQYAPLLNIKNKIRFAVNNDQLTIIPLDLEQPNNSNPHHFFYAGKAGEQKRKHDADVGRQELEAMLQE